MTAPVSRPAISWSRKYRPRKADAGHTAIRYGYGPYTGSGWRRTYVLCQCGKRYSGRGEEGGYRSHRRHQQRRAGLSGGSEPR